MELITFLVFIGVALLGWCCAALHEKVFFYIPEHEENIKQAHAVQEELSLKDILKTNSIKGFQAI